MIDFNKFPVRATFTSDDIVTFKLNASLSAESSVNRLGLYLNANAVSECVMALRKQLFHHVYGDFYKPIHALLSLCERDSELHKSSKYQELRAQLVQLLKFEASPDLEAQPPPTSS